MDPFNLETLISSGLWPGTVEKASYFIHEDVLQLWDGFRKQMPGSSERSFLESLNGLTLLNGRVSSIKHFICFGQVLTGYITYKHLLL